MKTIEEKAKAYDEALERARRIYKGNPSSGTAIVVCEEIFPELAESEDERIRKRIRLCLDECVHSDIIRDYERDECLAYLEKQEQKPTSFNEPYNPDEYEVVMEGNATSLKRKEQKPYCPSNDELEKAAKEFREKNVPPIEPISDELVEIIKGEFEGFRTLLKKKGIDYEPQRGYWEGFARLFDSSAREYVKEQKPTWSEEDKLAIDAAIYWLERRLRIEKVSDKSTGCSPLSMRKTAERLKSLRPCPSWKPSEEQIQSIIYLASSIPPNFLKEQKYTMRLVDEVIEELKKLGNDILVG